MSKKQNLLFKLVFTAILVALNIVLERLLAYSVWNQTISFSFVTIGFAAVFLGWPYAVAVATLGDFLGALILPFGPYFFGFTLTNALSAFLIGIFMRQNVSYIKIFIGVLLSKVFCTVLLNTVWISILYRGGLDAFPAVLITRLPQAGIMLVIECIVFIILFAESSKIRKQLDKAFANIFK